MPKTTLHNRITRYTGLTLIAFLLLLMTISCHIVSAQTLKIQLSASSVTFVDSSLMSKGDIPANENPITATVNYTGKGVVHIFMIANGNMTGEDGKVVIPINNVYWTASGDGYLPGTLSLKQEVEASDGPLSRDKSAGWNFFLKRGLYGAGSFHLSITLVATVQ